MKNKNNGYVASQGLRDTDLKQLIVVIGVWEEILSWVVHVYVPYPKGKKYTVTGIIFSLVKDALWMAMICVQLKIHQKNWENMSLVFNRCLVSVRSEQQWQHRLPHSWTPTSHPCMYKNCHQPPWSLHWVSPFSVSLHICWGKKPETPQDPRLEHHSCWS